MTKLENKMRRGVMERLREREREREERERVRETESDFC